MEAMKLQKKVTASAMLDPKILLPAIKSAFVKLDPRRMMSKCPSVNGSKLPTYAACRGLSSIIIGLSHCGAGFEPAGQVENLPRVGRQLSQFRVTLPTNTMVADCQVIT